MKATDNVIRFPTANSTSQETLTVFDALCVCVSYAAQNGVINDQGEHQLLDAVKSARDLWEHLN